MLRFNLIPANTGVFLWCTSSVHLMTYYVTVFNDEGKSLCVDFEDFNEASEFKEDCDELGYSVMLATEVW